MATIFMTPGNDYDANELESERQDIQDELEAEWEAEQERLHEESNALFAEPEAPFDTDNRVGVLRTIPGTPMRFN